MDCEQYGANARERVPRRNSNNTRNYDDSMSSGEDRSESDYDSSYKTGDDASDDSQEEDSDIENRAALQTQLKERGHSRRAGGGKTNKSSKKKKVTAKCKKAVKQSLCSITYDKHILNDC